MNEYPLPMGGSIWLTQRHVVSLQASPRSSVSNTLIRMTNGDQWATTLSVEEISKMWSDPIGLAATLS